MLTDITNNISKLPKWAQAHIKELQRQRDTAVRELNEWVDSQTPSPIYIEENITIGEQRGPSQKRRYIQGHRINIDFKGVSLEIILAENDGQRPDGINLQWHQFGKWAGDIAMIPRSFQNIALVAKENMR